MKKTIITTGMMLLVLQWGWCFNESQKNTLLKTMPSYLQTGNSAVSGEMKAYLDYFGLPYRSYRYRYGFISTDEGKLFMQSFAPENPQGVVIVSHGYLEHSGWTFELTRFLLNKNLSVVLYDHYGHGFSQGIPGHIDDFTQYGRGYQAVMETVQSLWPQGLYFGVGHSLGGATILQYVLSHPEHPLEAVIFAAPLVRSYLWRPSVAVANAVEALIRRIPRRFSYRDELMEKGKSDPLQNKTMPLSWLDALVRWDQWNSSYPQTETPLLLMQGDRDTVVDNDYNYQFIKDHFQTMWYHSFPEAGHLLFLEKEPILRQVLSQVGSFLDIWLEE